MSFSKNQCGGKRLFFPIFCCNAARASGGTIGNSKSVIFSTRLYSSSISVGSCSSRLDINCILMGLDMASQSGRGVWLTSAKCASSLSASRRRLFDGEAERKFEEGGGLSGMSMLWWLGKIGGDHVVLCAAVSAIAQSLSQRLTR